MVRLKVFRVAEEHDEVSKFWEDEKESLTQDCIAAMRVSTSGEYDDEETNEDPEAEEQDHVGMLATVRDVIVDQEEKEEKVGAHDDGKMSEDSESRWDVLRRHVLTNLLQLNQKTMRPS